MKSAVGIIVKDGIGRRVIIAPLDDMPNHVTEGEQIVIVPDYEVVEPVEFFDIPAVVHKAEEYLKTWSKSS